MPLEYSLVKRAVRASVIDGRDDDDTPDVVNVNGTVTFTPVMSGGDAVQVTVPGGMETLVLSPIECPINDGIISHRGRDGVKLAAGGEGCNPPIIRWKATFSHMQAGGWSFTLKPIIFDAIPSGEIDLTLAAPVAGQPDGIVRGPQGTSISNVTVENAEMVITATNESGSFVMARIPLDDVVRETADAAADAVRESVKEDAGRATSAATTATEAAADAAAAREGVDEAAAAATAAAGVVQQATEPLPQLLTDIGSASSTGLSQIADARASALSALDAKAQQSLVPRVDTTVGTRVFVGTTMIFGDTGWRDVTSLLVNGWAAKKVLLRRQGAEITLILNGLVAASATDNEVIRLGSGWINDAMQGSYLSIPVATAVESTSVMLLGSTLADVRFRGRPADVVSNALQWSTTRPWPTTLPGIPA